MPLTLRPASDILNTMLDSLLAGDPLLGGAIVTDINRISAMRQLMSVIAHQCASGNYDTFTALQQWYVTTAEDEDLATRVRDLGFEPDAGQAASDPVTVTRDLQYLDDIGLNAPVMVQATRSDGGTVLYRSLDTLTLQPRGRSVSGPSPGTSTTGGTTDTLTVNVNGDGGQVVTLGTQGTGVAVASALQAAVRALAAVTPANQAALSDFLCDYGITTPGRYTLRSGLGGPASSVVVTSGGAHNAAVGLKLGVSNGGSETAGQTSLSMPVICDQIGTVGNVGAGQINALVNSIPGVLSVANPLAFANGREPASNDATRQDFRRHLDALGVGGPASVEQAVYGALGADGQRHVFAAQVVHGAGQVQVYVCDGRSLTVGCQQDVLSDVENELLGLGTRPGGWIPVSTALGVVPATCVGVPFDVTVSIGRTSDPQSAAQAVSAALYRLVYQWAIGQDLPYAQAITTIDGSIPEMFGAVFTQPGAFQSTGLQTVPAPIGTKLMPSTIVVRTVTV